MFRRFKASLNFMLELHSQVKIKAAGQIRGGSHGHPADTEKSLAGMGVTSGDVGGEGKEFTGGKVGEVGGGGWVSGESHRSHPIN